MRSATFSVGSALLPIAAVMSTLWIPLTYAGTSCASNQMDWYTSVVGENPCEWPPVLHKYVNRTDIRPQAKHTSVCDAYAIQIVSLSQLAHAIHRVTTAVLNHAMVCSYHLR